MLSATFLIYSLVAQEINPCTETSDAKVLKLLSKAKNSKKYEYKQRVAFFKQAIEIDNQCVKCMWELGKLSFRKASSKGDKMEIPKKYFHQIEQICPDYHADLYYYLSRVYYAEVNDCESKKYFKKFLDFPTDNYEKLSRNYSDQVNSVKLTLPVAEFYCDFYANPVNFTPFLLKNISTASKNEFLPAISPDNELFYFTREYMYKAKGDVVAQLIQDFTVSKRQNTQEDFEGGMVMPSPFNVGPKYGGASISLNNKELYICACTKNGNYNNCDIFAFNDALYCLNQKRILKDDEIDPQWYINYTCGYDYYIPNLNETDIMNAKEYIMTILHNTLNPDNVDYVLKVVASFLKQSNPEEKAYFWLGRGRNGKGTITELIRNSLGKYWGELEMSNYTEKESGKNAPNQNLYDNQYSRVLNSSETDDDGDKTARFRSDFFKRITGGDYILARAVGKGDTVAYTAGKVLIQTNKMPYFAVMDAALKGRIIVIEFPYTFTDDVECIAQNPQKYKLKDPNLKHVFKQPVYRKAMFEIMFENYQKEVIIVPESVKQYTKSYFEEESVVSWVRQNYRLATEKEIQVGFSILLEANKAPSAWSIEHIVSIKIISVFKFLINLAISCEVILPIAFVTNH